MLLEKEFQQMRFPQDQAMQRFFERAKTVMMASYPLFIDMNLQDGKKDDIDVTVTRISRWKYVRPVRQSVCRIEPLPLKFYAQQDSLLLPRLVVLSSGSPEMPPDGRNFFVGLCDFPSVNLHVEWGNNGRLELGRQLDGNGRTASRERHGQLRWLDDGYGQPQWHARVD